MITIDDAKQWLELNSKLQKKKNTLRKSLQSKGVLKREAKNAFDKYSYFSEAQYKELFTELFAEAGLELKFTEIEYSTFVGSEKQSNGRMPKLEFELFDVETGFGEVTKITGEGIDKGDKAGYKGYTGALKYYLATTFMVATGDDPEKYTPKDNGKKETKKITPRQIEILESVYVGENLSKLLKANNITRIEDMELRKASELIQKIKGGDNNGR